jgi:hypothetical protein
LRAEAIANAMAESEAIHLLASSNMDCFVVSFLEARNDTPRNDELNADV